MAFVKLDTTMLRSSIWVERDHRSLFVTALLMCEPFEVREPMAQLEVRSLNETGWMVPPGWYGLAQAAGSGIVRTDGMEQEAGLDALEVLGSTDPESRSQDFEGRRLVRVDGGFLCLNYMKYRDHDHTAAERQRRLRERKKNAQNASPVTRYEVEVTRDVALQSHIAEGRKQKAEADTNNNTAHAERFGNADQLTAYQELRKAASLGTSFDAGLAAVALPPSGGQAYSWATIGRALGDFYAANGAVRMTPAALRAFCRRIESDDARPVDQLPRGTSKQERGRAALTETLRRRGYTNGIDFSHHEVPRPIPRALPNPGHHGSDR